MADLRSDLDASTVFQPWFEQIGISAFAAVGALLGLAISLLFVLKASPAAPAPLTQPIAALVRPATNLPSPKPALQVEQSPDQGDAQDLRPLLAPVKQASAAQTVPDQNAADDQTQAEFASEQSPPISQQATSHSVAAIPGSSLRDETTVRSPETSAGSTANGIPLHVGPRGGVYHYSTSGKKVYERKRR